MRALGYWAGLWLGTLMINAMGYAEELTFKPAGNLMVIGHAAVNDLSYPAVYLDSTGNTPSPKAQAAAWEVDLSFTPTIGFKSQDSLTFHPGIDLTYIYPSAVLDTEDPVFMYREQLIMEYWLGANVKTWPGIRMGGKVFGRTEDLPYYQNETLAEAYYNAQEYGGVINMQASYHPGLAMESRLEGSWSSKTFPDYYSLYIDDGGLRRPQANNDNSNNSPRIPPQTGETTVINPVTDTIALIEQGAEAEALDFNATHLQVGQRLGNEKNFINLDVMVSLAQWDYDQVGQIQADGTINETIKRQDLVREIYIQLPLYIHEHHEVTLGYLWRLCSSNQNYFLYDDSTGRDVFVPSYFDFDAQAITSHYLFQFPFKLGAFAPEGLLKLGYFLRQYHTRPSRQTSATQPLLGLWVFKEPLKEQGLSASFRIRQPLLVHWWRLILQYQWISHWSNNNVEYDPDYAFNYIYGCATIGTEISF